MSDDLALRLHIRANSKCGRTRTLHRRRCLLLAAMLSTVAVGYEAARADVTHETTYLTGTNTFVTPIHDDTVSVTNLTRTGLTSGSGSGSFPSTNNNTTDTIDFGNKYIGYSIAPMNGRSLLVKSVSITTNGSSTSPAQIAVGYSSDISFSTYNCATSLFGTSYAAFTTNVNLLTSDAVYIRAQAYGSTSVGGGTSTTSGIWRVQNPTAIESAYQASDAIGLTADTEMRVGISFSFNAPISGAYAINKTGSGTVALNRDNAYTNTTISAGTLIVGGGLNLGSLGTGTITNNASLVFRRSNAYTVAAAIRGSGNVYQIGTGATILSAANNDYAGATGVNGGQLIVNGSLLSGGSIAVGAGTLGGNGSIARDVQINSGASLSPGATTDYDIASLAMSQTTTLKGGGQYIWQIDSANGLAGTNWDLLELGTLSVAATQADPFTIRIISLNGAGTAAGALSDVSLGMEYRFKIADVTTFAETFNPAAFRIDSTGFSANQPGTWSLERSGGQINAIYSVPEPSAALLLLAGAGAILARRRPHRPIQSV